MAFFLVGARPSLIQIRSKTRTWGSSSVQTVQHPLCLAGVKGFRLKACSKILCTCWGRELPPSESQQRHKNVKDETLSIQHVGKGSFKALPPINQSCEKYTCWSPYTKHLLKGTFFFQVETGEWIEHVASAINRSRDKVLMKIVEVRLVQSKIFQMPTICALLPEDLYTLYLKKIKDNQVVLFNLNRNCFTDPKIHSFLSSYKWQTPNSTMFDSCGRGVFWKQP